jgi:hypothetical protein
MWEQFLAFFTPDNGIFVAIGFLGMLAHALKKFYKNELSGSVYDYLFNNNKKRTVLAIMANVGALVTVVLSGQLPSQIGAFILLAFTTGFTADATVNSDSAPAKEDEPQK